MGYWNLGIAAVGLIGGYVSSQSDAKNAASASAADAARIAASQATIAEATANYNKLAEKRPGTKFKQWKNSYLQGITDPDLKREILELQEEDLNNAQSFADKSSTGNLDNFLKIAGKISGGNYDRLMSDSIKEVDEEDTDSRMERAMQLAAPFMSADGVRSSNSRSSKRIFGVSFDVDQQSRDRRRGLRDAVLGNVAKLADAQKERAFSFLDFADRGPTLAKIGLGPLEAKMEGSKRDEEFQRALITLAAGSASGMSATTPQKSSLSSVDWGSLVATGAKGAAASAKSSSLAKAAKA
jgi:hypothetical protein